MARLSTEKIWEFAEALKQTFSTPSDTRAATVQSVDNDGTVWVVYPGASSPTPIASVGAAVEPGDYVYTQLLNGRLVLTTNKSDPAIGGTKTRAIVNAITQPINRAVVIAKGIADEANAVANAINQHFWNDTNGAHVTDVTQDEWKAAVDDGFSDYDADTKPYHNLLMNSLGILLRTALNNLVSITRSAIAFYDGDGNDASNIVARFGSDGAQIGRAGESHMEMDYHSLQMVDRDGFPYFDVRDMRDSDGYATVSERFVGDGSKVTFSVQMKIADETNVSATVNGATTTVSSVSAYSYTVTLANAPAAGAAVVITYTTDSPSAKSYTLGSRRGGYPDGPLSYVEGISAAATGFCSHADGYGNIASGDYSYAGGGSSKASHLRSYARGYQVLASSEDQTVIGTYNVEDASHQYAFIIGNGTDDANRSNAFAVDWDGGITTAKPLFTTITANSTTATVNAGAGFTATITLSPPTGYKPVAIARVTHTHGYVGSLGQFSLTSDTRAQVSITNRGSTQWTDEVVTIDVLCALSTVL